VAWTTPRSWSAGETVTSTILNTHVRDNLNAIVSPPYAFVRATTATALNSSGWTAIAFNTEVADTDNMWVSSAATRMTINTAGLYLITGGYGLNLTANTYTRFTFAVNGANVPTAGSNVGAGDVGMNAEVSASLFYRFSVADYVEVKGLTTSTNVNTVITNGDQAYCQARWMGP
jgi:hypothetical protein